MADSDELSKYLVKGVEGLEEGAVKEERRAGAGSYGYVFQVTVGGVQRIAKKLHSLYVNQEVSAKDRKSITSKFRNECVILSKLRHPNIVQFIGVHYGRRGKADLTLIMECVNSDMDKFLEVHPNIPLPLKLTLLLDVSYGLVYLHECNPPIVHRDLTAGNVLITDKCEAKIADLGMAKIMDTHARLATSHTQTPGQMFYMPPEALKEKASCTPKLDIFSFGHLSLYVANQEFPKVYNITQTMAVQKQGIVERLKHKRALDCIESNHCLCLLPVIVDCLGDNPTCRPCARALNRNLVDLSSQNPASLESVLQLQGNEVYQAASTERCELQQEIAVLKQGLLYAQQEYEEKLNQVKKEKDNMFEELQALATSYKEDFLEEHNDHEKAQSRMASMQIQYKHQFNKLGEELATSQKHCKRLKGLESDYQAQVSQLQAKIKRLEEDLASKMQQVKQYKKQEDHHVLELVTFKEAYDIQKLQIHHLEQEANQMHGQNEVLQQESNNLKTQLDELHIADRDETQASCPLQTKQTQQDFHVARRADVITKGKVASGAWGVVSIGEFRGCKVAIKELRQQIMHESTVDRMKHEVKLMARMHHPNIVTFIGANFDDGKLPMFIMELMEANLRITYEDSVLTQDQMVSIFKDIACALDYLHEFKEPIIHRNVSATNVFLNSLPKSRYQTKLSGFGSATFAKDPTGELASLCSAPEASLPGANQTVKMDSYSYGKLLCEVINREVMIGDECVETLPKEWHDLVTSCTEKDPAKRPSMTSVLGYLELIVQ